MLDLPKSVRVAGEFTQVTGKRIDAPDLDGRSLLFEARYRF
jgi:hypothetical protein